MKNIAGVRANCQLPLLPPKLAALLGTIHGVVGDHGVAVMLGLSPLNSSGKSVSGVDSAIELLSPLDASAWSHVIRAKDRSQSWVEMLVRFRKPRSEEDEPQQQ
jgi:hypothetical protein